MSVLSAQCERLLALASNLKQTTRGHNEYVTAMREAAYTIWQLRNTNLDTANENDQLKAENAELRELIADMWRFTGEACKKYPRLFDPPAQGGQMVQPNMIDSFEQRMRELGVEVD